MMKCPRHVLTCIKRGFDHRMSMCNSPKHAQAIKTGQRCLMAPVVSVF
jgi:hypothetical protein